MKIAHHIIRFAGALGMALAAGTAAAQTAGFDADRFASSATSGGYVSVEAPHMSAEPFTMGVHFAYLDLPLTLVHDTARYRVVTSRSELVMLASLAPMRGLEIGVQAPFIAQQQGAIMSGPMNANGSGVGDVRVVPKWTVLDGTVGLALLMPVRAPTGNDALYMGGGHWAIEPTLALQAGGRTLRVGVNAGYRPIPEHIALTTRITDQVFGGLGIGVHVAKPVELLTEARFVTDVADAFQVGSTPVEAVGGVRYDAGSWSFLAGGGAGVVNGYGATAGRAFVQANFNPLALPIAPLPPMRATPAVAEIKKPEPPKAAPPAPPAPEAQVVVTNKEIVTMQPIFFETNKWDIRPQFVPTLEAIRDSLEKWNGISALYVQGHADITGPHRWNQKLSLRRAEAIVAWLIDHGIAPERLVPMGFAEEQPWTTNETTLGRARNRRVMFKIETWIDGSERPGDVVEPTAEEVQP